MGTISKLEEFIINELIIILINDHNYNETKNDFLMQCEEYIEWLNISNRNNKHIKKPFVEKKSLYSIIKIVQGKMLLDEYEETLDMLNNYIDNNKVLKYLVFGGYVISINDGDKHWVTPEQVIKLYKVNPKECRMIKQEKDLFGFNKKYYNLIELRPRDDGNYDINNIRRG